jgi:hypothetical protein
MLVDYPSELLPLYLYILEWEKCTLQSLLFLQAEKYGYESNVQVLSLSMPTWRLGMLRVMQRCHLERSAGCIPFLILLPYTHLHRAAVNTSL